MVSFSLKIKRINTIKATPAKIELNDTNRVESKVIKKTTKQIKATKG